MLAATPPRQTPWGLGLLPTRPLPTPWPALPPAQPNPAYAAPPPPPPSLADAHTPAAALPPALARPADAAPVPPPSRSSDGPLDLPARPCAAMACCPPACLPNRHALLPLPPAPLATLAASCQLELPVNQKGADCQRTGLGAVPAPPGHQQTLYSAAKHYGTGDSRVIPQHSTNPAQSSLTSEF